MIVADADIETVLNAYVYRLYARAHHGEVAGSAVGSIISDAAEIDMVLRAPDRFHKNYALIAALGHSRFSTNGAQWERRRELTQPAYARAGIRGSRAAIATRYAETLAACEATEPRAIQRALMRASATIFLSAFGPIAATDSLMKVFDQARRVLKRLQYYSWYPPDEDVLPVLRKEAGTLLENFSREMVGSPRLLELLGSMQESCNEDDSFAAPSEFLMNFFAGVETTAATLCFAIDRLGIDRRVEQRLFDEVDAAETPFIDCYLNETMRYFPPIPFVARQVVVDTQIAGTTYRAGQLLILSVVEVHHDKMFWNEPHIFNCSRAEFIRDSYDRRAFIPFLAGPRMCGGARLARMELTEGLKAFLRRFKVERQGDEIRFDYGLALRPHSWDKVQISRRL